MSAQAPGLSRRSVLSDLAEYFRYQRETGLREIEASADVLSALDALAGGGPADSAPAEKDDRSGTSLETVSDRIRACTKCSLHETRTSVVPGQGNASPEIMFIGEAPGYEEDQQGLAFVGAAGQLLTKMIEAMGCTRDEVFIANILKCRPPDNRAPRPDEMETCMPYLKEQIKLLRPRVIVALGATAAKALLQTTTGITRLRGKWMLFEGIDLMPTYHPAYLLRTPSAKRQTWEDLKAVLVRLGREAPPAKKR